MCNNLFSLWQCLIHAEDIVNDMITGLDLAESKNIDGSDKMLFGILHEQCLF